MPNIKILYKDVSSDENKTLSMYANSRNEIFIEIDSKNCLPSFICLDRWTAIKLAKELRKEISYLIDDRYNE